MGARLDRIVKGTLHGNLSPITPTKGPRDLARAHQRAIETEDRQLAAVAATLDAVAAGELQSASSFEGAEPATAAPKVAPVEDSPEFDPRKPFAEVRGEPGVSYVQGENYFARDKAFVKQAPEHAWYSPPEPTPKTHADAVRAAQREFSRLPQVPRAPQSVIDAERENARAAAAEAHAE